MNELLSLFGFRRTVPQMLGITFGFGSMVLATGLGLAGVVHAEPRLHVVLKYAGALYLLYLAWRIARADATSASARAKPIGFIEATVMWAGFGTVIGRYLADLKVRKAFNWSMAGPLALSLIAVFR
jgi:threonine/homoserine/homoserine lactone efflux protein